MQITFNASKTLSFVYHRMNKPFVSNICLTNTDRINHGDQLVRPRVRFEAPGIEEVAEVWVGNPRPIPNSGYSEDTSVVWDRPSIRLNKKAMGNLKEVVEGDVIIEILDENDQVLLSERRDITLLSPKDWLLDPMFFESLAGFVIPSSDFVQDILRDVRTTLQKNTGDGTLMGDKLGDGHTPIPGNRNDNPAWERVDEIAKTIYETIVSRKLSYSFWEVADWVGATQRIRTPDDMLGQDLSGTCLDTTVLFAACMAEARLSPVIVLVQGHAYIAYSYHEHTTQHAQIGDPVIDDQDHAKNWLETGLQPIETTVCTQGLNFREAVLAGEANTNKYFGTIKLLFVNSAWRRGVSLAPTQEISGAEYEDYAPGVDQIVVDEQVRDLVDPKIVVDEGDRAGSEWRPPRVRQWLASLLDLGARNPLLRVNISKKTGRGRKGLIEFNVPPNSLSQLDDDLCDGKTIVINSPSAINQRYWEHGITISEFVQEAKILESPLVYPKHSEIGEFSPNVNYLINLRDTPEENVKPEEYQAWKFCQRANDPYIRDHVSQVLQQKWDKAQKTAFTKLRTEANDQLLLTGTNSLFLTIGMLTWTEQTDFRGSASNTKWSAPLYLYPVILEGGRGTPYSIRLDGHGSITPNYSLREKLLREPTLLDLPELEFPKIDDSGIDVDANLASIKAKISEAKLDMTVEERCCLGIFDYSNFLLWKDLNDSWEEMANTSPAVKHLMYTANDAFEEKLEPNETELLPHCPHPSDDSQMEAIKWALKGRSFRLEGPPGTGKTQTITNLIASCLANGKKILFVAEKSVALQQVKERLYEVGLGNFCLELHAKGDSDTRIRQNILEQIVEANDASADRKDHEWDDLTFKSNHESTTLDKYKDALHEQNTVGQSMWTAHNQLLNIGEGPSVEPPTAFMTDYENVWPTFRQVAVDLPQAIQIAGGLNTNPWRFTENIDFDTVNRDNLTDIINSLESAVSDFKQLTGKWAHLHRVHGPDEIQDAVNAMKMIDLDLLPTPDEMHLMGGETWKTAVTDICANALELNNQSSNLFDVVSQTVLDRSDFSELEKQTQAVTSANIFTKGGKRKHLLASLGTDAISTDAKQIHAAMVDIVTFQPKVSDLKDNIRKDIGLNLKNSHIFFSKDGQKTLESFFSALITLTSSEKSPALLNFITELTANANIEQLPRNIVEKVNEQWNTIRKVLPYSPTSTQRWTDGLPFLDVWEENMQDWVTDRGENNRYLTLDRWQNVVTHTNTLEQLGLTGLGEQILTEQLSVGQLEEQVLRGLLQKTIRERREAGDLDRFDGETHNQHIDRLEDLQIQLRELMKQRVPGIIAGRKSKMPFGNNSFGEGSALAGELKTKKKSARKPIRDLIEKYSESLAKVMPCFLMSPASVSNFIPVGSIEFDLVIFDEASQIPTSHAIGALGRGKANIVVGDTKQMPPPSHFSSNQGREIEDVESEYDVVDDPDALPALIAQAATDSESILEEFDDSRLPFLQLRCHYRSKDEALIAFSNNEIYTAFPMMTFPSVNGIRSTALKWCSVPNGQFHRPQTDLNKLTPDQQEAAFRAQPLINSLKGTNPLEAEAAVSEVWQRLTDPERVERRRLGARDGAESMIVVTFNKQQRDLIMELLREKDAQNPDARIYAKALEEKYNEETGVLEVRPQLKIINLEHVQGDEADTVIFSTAFTKKGGGHANPDDPKVPTNWGPVTQPGGYRRLNVAVTRAKREMLVFCSFDPEDIAIKPSSNENIVLVQKFLKLAKHGPQASGDYGLGSEQSTHLEQIAHEIRQRGYNVETQVGLSKLRVDIAVSKPDSEKMQLGILLDGPNWSDRGSAMQREILPRTMLTALGWENVMRIWLPSWADEKQRILQKVEDLLEGRTEVATVATEETVYPDRPNDPSQTPQPSSDRVRFIEYEPFNPRVKRPEKYTVLPANPYLWGGANLTRQERDELDKNLRATIECVLDQEAPITTKRLGNLVAETWNYEQTSRSRNFVLRYVDKNLITSDEYGDFVWKSPTQSQNLTFYRPSEERVRDINEIHPQEYLQCLLHLIEVGRSMEREEAAKGLAKMYAFRNTARIKNHMEAMIDYALQNSDLTESEGILSLSLEE